MSDGDGKATGKGSGAPRRNWRLYGVAALGFALVCGVAATVGQIARAHQATAVSAPKGAVGHSGGTQLDLPVRPTVPVTLTVYEDPRSPQSREFAQRYADTLARLLASGQAQINYRLVTQSDKQYGGSGATEAAAAAACAQDQKRFAPFMDQIWRHQPAPAKDAFTDRKLLSDLAKKAGKINHDSFEMCVDRSDRKGWVARSQSEFAASGLGEVPVVEINGRPVPGSTAQLTPGKLSSLVHKEAQRVAAAAKP
ncbi:DsbA family protein [Streptomyces kronopolitis]|uniref:DsbA family protein n=1 Tax=Streptomyces kronopolitis TaxID=1612435 RepID=UPI0034368B3A